VNETETEETLMVAYVAGDERAFARLFARLAPRVHGFFVRSFRDPAVADDLLQTTFLHLHRARADYQKERRLRPWVFAIAARVRLDELRRRHRLAEDADEAAIDNAAAEPSAAPGDEALDLRVKVQRALDRLPQSQRVVVLLHRFEGMTFGEIASALGATESAVKLRAFRAYRQLREFLGPLLAEERAA
jgi:RNA polymerase sigma-70 factor (ECF subfamily)